MKFIIPNDSKISPFLLEKDKKAPYNKIIRIIYYSIRVAMKNLIIIGASGCGRETYCLATTCPEYNVEWRVKGFLDSRLNVLDGYEGYPPILGGAEEYEVQSDDVFVCAQGDSPARKKYTQLIEQKGGTFISLISPEAAIGKNTKIGRGCVISANVRISCDIEIGNHVKIQNFTTLGHDVKIGDFATLQCYCFFGGFSRVEEECMIYTGAKILPHKTVGKGASVGAGSVVVRNVKPFITIHGNPASKLC